jgi:hypothetical protein
MRFLLLIVGLFTILTGSFPVWSAEPVIKEGDHLTLEQCIDIAVRNQPSILQYLYTGQGVLLPPGRRQVQLYRVQRHHEVRRPLLAHFPVWI